MPDDLTVRISEDNDAVVIFDLVEVDQDGNESPFPYDDTAGDTFEFFAKNTKAESRADAFAVYTQVAGHITVGTMPTTATVQLSAADFPAPGVYRYLLDVLKGGLLRQTVAFGDLVVEDT